MDYDHAEFLKKIAYFCPIDWQWIKQRPQFLAEELNEYYDVSVLYPWRNRRKGLQRKSVSALKPIPIFSLPTLGGRLKSIGTFNRMCSRTKIKHWLKKERPHYLWISMPWQVELIPEALDIPIIYDCMDDYTAITIHSGNESEIIRQEKNIVERATVIFASSQNLCRLLDEKYRCAEKIHLLRNGYYSGWKYENNARPYGEGTFKIGYFGTIGRWFDFSLLTNSLAIQSNIEYHLYGPAENGVTVPRHDRILVYGSVEHNEIPEKMRDMDALIMPFVPNKIVQSVDPVKLYEYIFLGKNILCIRYPEIERFAPFVNFYSDEKEYNEKLQMLMADNRPAYTATQAEVFLKENTWTKRAEYVYEILKQM